jgi:hypothetical protein
MIYALSAVGATSRGEGRGDVCSPVTARDLNVVSALVRAGALMAERPSGPIRFQVRHHLTPRMTYAWHHY